MSIDKAKLYGRFLASAERRERLADLATRKALDLPAEDEMQIHTQQSGLELRHLLGMAALLISAAGVGGAGGLGLAAASGWLQRGGAAATPAAPAASSVKPAAEQQFEVTFWTAEGKPIAAERGAEGKEAK